MSVSTDLEMKVVHQNTSLRPTVLVVDDDKENLNAFHSSFRRDANVLLASTAQEALAFLAKEEVHVLITDQRMPEVTGAELLAIVKEKYPFVRRLIATAYTDVEALIDAVNDGGLMGYIAKPWKTQEVWAMVHIAHLAYIKEKNTADHIAKLEDMNSKLEFALRQKLLS